MFNIQFFCGLRYTLHTLKQYVETHLALRAEKELAASLGSPSSPEPARPVFRPYRLSQDQVTQNIHTLLNIMHYRARSAGPPLRHFISSVRVPKAASFWSGS
jgi:hypothetical protein